MNYGTRVLMVGAPLVVIARYFISLTAVAEAVLLFLWRWCRTARMRVIQGLHEFVVAAYGLVK